MQMNYSKTIILIMLFFAYFYTARSEELESLSENPAAKQTQPLTLVLKNSDNNPAKALIQLNTSETDNQSRIFQNWSAADNQITFNLPAAYYQIIINGGLRRISQILNIHMPEFANHIQNITLKPYAPVEPAGWIMLDPVFLNSTENSTLLLKKNAAALQIRGVFSNYITADSSIFKSLHNCNSCFIAPLQKTVHPFYGMYLSFLSSDKYPTTTQYPDKTPLYSRLFREHDNNNITALSPYIIDRKINKQHPLPASEFIFDTIAGPLYDILLLPDLEHSIKTWYVLLNKGYRLPAIFAELKPSPNSSIPQTRLYVKVPRKNFSLKMIHDILKNGNSIISNGPFIRLFVENIDPANPESAGIDNTEWINGNSTKIGGIAFIDKQPRNIFAEAYTCSDPTDSIDHIDLIYNGKVIKTISAKEGQKSLQLKWKLKLDQSGWLQLRYYSKNPDYYALTNPIYLVDYHSRLPEPAISKTQVQVLDKQTGKPIPARITISNFGINIDSLTTADHPVIIQAPATADIIAEVKGYKTAKQSIYLDGGSADYIEMLKKKNLLERAQEDSITYKYLQKALLNSKLIFRLEKK